MTSKRYRDRCAHRPHGKRVVLRPIGSRPSMRAHRFARYGRGQICADAAPAVVHAGQAAANAGDHRGERCDETPSRLGRGYECDRAAIHVNTSCRREPRLAEATRGRAEHKMSGSTGSEKAEPGAPCFGTRLFPKGREGAFRLRHCLHDRGHSNRSQGSDVGSTDHPCAQSRLYRRRKFGYPGRPKGG